MKIKHSRREKRLIKRCKTLRDFTELFGPVVRICSVRRGYTLTSMRIVLLQDGTVVVGGNSWFTHGRNVRYRFDWTVECWRKAFEKEKIPL